MPAAILPLIDAATHWPDRGALIGLDLGTRTIGVAVSDPDRKLATGIGTIQRKAFKADAAQLLAIAGERQVVGFVLGLPINMDASEGPRAQSTRAFARNFSNMTDLAIALWDERLSTVAVERELIGMDMSRARRAKARVDCARGPSLPSMLIGSPSTNPTTLRSVAILSRAAVSALKALR
jgi:putative Holliday junction resolvase